MCIAGRVFPNATNPAAARTQAGPQSFCPFVGSQKLNAHLKTLTGKRDELQGKVTALASGKDLKALEAATVELGKLAEELDEAEMTWLEFAEIAGDI